MHNMTCVYSVGAIRKDYRGRTAFKNCSDILKRGQIVIFYSRTFVNCVNRIRYPEEKQQ